MEPRIQYAKTADGVSIAFWTLGQGPPLVVTAPTGWSHIGLELRLGAVGAWYERLAEGKMVVRFDIRGTGLSDRKATSVSLDTLASDVAAVADKLGLDRFALLGQVYGGRLAIAYAAQNPERLSHLLLWCTAAGAGAYRRPQAEAATTLIDKDWELFTETIAHATVGWESGGFGHSLAAYMRESVTPEVYKALMTVGLAMVTDRLPQIAVPTLVMHRREITVPDISEARELASRIPGARLALFDGTGFGPSPSEGDVEPVLAAINEFLAEGEPAASLSEPAAGAFRTVLFTDLVGHTEMMSRLGDERGRAVLREHERITRGVLKAHGGTEVKTMGDGFMASFGSVTKAVECAIALQRAFDERNRGVGAGLAPPEGAASRAPTSPPARPEVSKERAGHEPLHVRVGLNAGEPIEEEGDLFGATVILAARIAAKADGGEILVANAVRELCSGKGFLFSDRGDFVAKGFEEPVRVYEVRWHD